jgi:hypothetical protein
VLRSFAKILVASVIMAVVAWWVEAHLRIAFPAISTWVRLMRVGTAIGTGIGALALAAWALRIDEFHQALGRITDRLKR